MAYKEDVNTELIITVGAVSGFVVIVLMIGLQAWFASEEQREITTDYSKSTNTQLTDLRTQQEAKITGYRWVDKDKKVVAIPIDEAKKLLIENNGKLPTTTPAK